MASPIELSRVVNPESELLEALYSAAVAFVYPSRFEGFGWPIIEAQACGCPVICSNREPLPEVAGDAAMMHDVSDEAAFAADVLRLLDPNEREQWSRKSLQNAARYRAEEMISRYIALYRELEAQCMKTFLMFLSLVASVGIAPAIS